MSVLFSFLHNLDDNLPITLCTSSKWDVKLQKLLAISTKQLAREPFKNIQLNIGSKFFFMKMSLRDGCYFATDNNNQLKVIIKVNLCKIT